MVAAFCLCKLAGFWFVAFFSSGRLAMFVKPIVPKEALPKQK